MSETPKTNVKINGNPIPWLFDYVKRHINLGTFLETETGCTVTWSEQDVSGKCICPLPSHKEKAPSFMIECMEDGVWVYNCFGCNSGGTIIDFCQEYFGYKLIEALKFLCEKYNITQNDEAISFDNKRVNYRKKIECAHIVVANQCRLLLRKDQKKYSKFVSSVYKQLNRILDEDSQETLDTLGKMEFKLCRMLGGE